MDRERLKSSLGSFLTLLCDLMLLNVLWLVCALPILTAGPSTSALFACMLKISRDELGESTFLSFFRAFKENFRNSFWYGLIAIAVAAIIYIDISFALTQTGLMRSVYLIASGCLIMIWLIFVSYVFALQARYENTFKLQIKNSFLIAFCAPGRTLLMWITYAIPIALLVLLPFETVLSVGFLFLMFVVSLPVYFNCRILRKIFDKFIKDVNTDEKSGSEEAG